MLAPLRGWRWGSLGTRLPGRRRRGWHRLYFVTLGARPAPAAPPRPSVERSLEHGREGPGTEPSDRDRPGGEPGLSAGRPRGDGRGAPPLGGGRGEGGGQGAVLEDGLHDRLRH